MLVYALGFLACESKVVGTHPLATELDAGHSYCMALLPVFSE